jgi:branched-subunit amino acid transport protein AzlD
MSESYAIFVILMMSVISLFLRAFPFLFMELYKNKGVVTYLGAMLPASVMIILVFYSLKDISLSRYPYGIPEISSSLLVALLHLYKRNIFISIGVGTACYAGLICLMH